MHSLGSRGRSLCGCHSRLADGTNTGLTWKLSDLSCSQNRTIICVDAVRTKYSGTSQPSSDFVNAARDVVQSLSLTTLSHWHELNIAAHSTDQISSLALGVFDVICRCLVVGVLGGA